MANRSDVEITIGGTLPLFGLRALWKGFVADRARMDRDGCCIQGFRELAEAAIGIAEQGVPLVLFKQDTSWQLETVQAVCQELGLPYAFDEGGGGDWGEFGIYWQPGMAEPKSLDTSEGEPTLTVAAVRSHLAGGTLAATLDGIEAMTKVPPLAIVRRRGRCTSP